MFDARSIENPSVLFDGPTVVPTDPFRSIPWNLIVNRPPLSPWPYTWTSPDFSPFLSLKPTCNTVKRYVLILPVSRQWKETFVSSQFVPKQESIELQPGSSPRNSKARFEMRATKRDGKDQGRCFLVPGRGMHLSRQLRRDHRHRSSNYFPGYLFISRSICVAKSTNLVSSTISSDEKQQIGVDAVNYDHHESPIKPDSRWSSFSFEEDVVEKDRARELCKLKWVV